MKPLSYTAKFQSPMMKEAFKDAAGVEITLQHLLFECATRGIPGDESMSLPDKLNFSKLAGQIVETKELKSADLHKLRERGNKFLSILALGFVSEQIDLALGEKDA